MVLVYTDECCSRSLGCLFHTTLALSSHTASSAQWHHTNTGRSLQPTYMHVLHLLWVTDETKSTATNNIHMYVCGQSQEKESPSSLN